MNHNEREEIRKKADEMANLVDKTLDELKKSQFGKIKVAGIESASFLVGASVSGICKLADVPIETTFAAALITALPHVISSASLPFPNRISEIINGVTIKYLAGATLPYVKDICESYFR
jgi:hypothetical protein